MVVKLLCAIHSKFLQIASTIEQFGNREEMSVEGAVGSLKAHEERMIRKIENSEGQLLLIKAEWSKRENCGERLLFTIEEWIK